MVVLIVREVFSASVSLAIKVLLPVVVSVTVPPDKPITKSSTPMGGSFIGFI